MMSFTVDTSLTGFQMKPPASEPQDLVEYVENNPVKAGLIEAKNNCDSQALAG
jgi:hypothetical protein